MLLLCNHALGVDHNLGKKYSAKDVLHTRQTHLSFFQYACNLPSQTPYKKSFPIRTLAIHRVSHLVHLQNIENNVLGIYGVGYFGVKGGTHSYQPTPAYL